jgi:hypothetical protein
MRSNPLGIFDFLFENHKYTKFSTIRRSRLHTLCLCISEYLPYTLVLRLGFVCKPNIRSVCGRLWGV